VDFSVLEQNKEIVYPECEDEIHSIAMNPTAGKIIKVNYKYFTEDEDERRALASGLCLNTNPNMVRLLNVLDLFEYLSEDDWTNLAATTEAGKYLHYAYYTGNPNPPNVDFINDPEERIATACRLVVKCNHTDIYLLATYSLFDVLTEEDWELLSKYPFAKSIYKKYYSKYH
jgi:hypothetical protein